MRTPNKGKGVVPEREPVPLALGHAGVASRPLRFKLTGTVSDRVKAECSKRNMAPNILVRDILDMWFTEYDSEVQSGIYRR